MLRKQERTILGQNNSRYLSIALFAPFILWAVVTLRNVWFASDTFGVDYWYSQHHVANFALAVIYTAFIWVLAMWFVAFKFITIMHVMRSICVELTKKKVIRVRPMSPDKAGGLGGLGAYSILLVLILALPVVPVISRIMTGTVHTGTMLSGSLFVPLLTLAFFYPLSGAHRAMRKAKSDTLARLSRQFNGIYDKFMTTVKADRTRGTDADFALADKADKVEKLYAKAQQMPVWPFNLATLGKFSGILLTAALTVWLKVIIGWLSGI